MKPEIVTWEPQRASQNETVLFVHGIYHDASGWDAFARYFAERGYGCRALILRGHGSDPDGASLRNARFADYLQDLRFALAELDEAPILIGHSLGGLLIQKLIEVDHAPAPAVVLISTPTPRSLRRAFWLLLRRFPRPALRMLLTLNPEHIYKDPVIVRKLFFSDTPDTPAIQQALGRILAQPESRRIFFDVMLLNMRAPARKTPTLVLGGAADYAIGMDAFEATARLHNVRPVVLPGAPHDLMLYREWERAATLIVDWLEWKR
ncbi:MAG: alpha/beta hydrolase [Opitutales bacterium]